MYDYVSTVSPDYAVALSVSPQEALTESLEKSQVIHEFDDGSERVITLDSTSRFNVKLRWTRGITKSDAGIILDFFADAAKANGYARSFKWAHLDGHTYVVKCRSPFNRDWFENPDNTYHRVQEVVLKVMGRISD